MGATNLKKGDLVRIVDSDFAYNNGMIARIHESRPSGYVILTPPRFIMRIALPGGTVCVIHAPEDTHMFLLREQVSLLARMQHETC